MQDYRLSFHDEDGQYERSLTIIASDDEHALKRASEMDHPFTIEVWDAERRVGTVKARLTHPI